MTGAVAVFALIIAAVNPPTVLPPGPERRRRALGALLGLVVVGAVAGVTEPILVALDLSVASFRTGAALVVGLTGARWLVGPSARIGPNPYVDGGLGSLTPGALAAAMATTADDGTVLTWAALAAAGLLAVGASFLPDLLARWLARMLGAAAIILAVGVAVSGIKSV